MFTKSLEDPDIPRNANLVGIGGDSNFPIDFPIVLSRFLSLFIPLKLFGSSFGNLSDQKCGRLPVKEGLVMP